MQIDYSLQPASLAPALARFWALSGAKIDLILKGGIRGRVVVDLSR